MSAWIDSSDVTHLVLCTRCPYIVGPFFNRTLALEARKTHNAEHRAEDQRVWTRNYREEPA